MYIGDNNVEKLYIGNTEVERVYLGTDVIYEKASPTPTGGIHLTNDGMGIVFPAGTYQNKDGRPDFQEDTGGGSSQSDSITFDTDITFPSDNSSGTVYERYMWNESNSVSYDPYYPNGNIDIYAKDAVSNSWHLISTDRTKPSTTTCYNRASYSDGRDVFNFVSPAAPYNYSLRGYTDVKYVYKNLNSSTDNPNAVPLPTNIKLTIYQSGFITRPNSTLTLTVYNSDDSVKATYTAVTTTKSNYTYYTIYYPSGSDTIDMGNGKWFDIVITGTGWKSESQTTNETTRTVTLYTNVKLNSIEPKVVKLGLSGATYGYSPDFVDKNITLGSDTRNAWNLGYVKFSDSEAGKLVQYSKTPIT